MVLVAAAVERAMKRQEVIMRALSGALTWLQAADILGMEPRSLRRWRARTRGLESSRSKRTPMRRSASATTACLRQPLSESGRWRSSGHRRESASPA